MFVYSFYRCGIVELLLHPFILLVNERFCVSIRVTHTDFEKEKKENNFNKVKVVHKSS